MKITEGPFWLLDFNCGVVSSSAAFIKNTIASNKGAPAMHVYAVDSILVMVEATQRRLSAQIMLLNGTPPVVNPRLWGWRIRILLPRVITRTNRLL
jgi:hypothetical protein